jgi:hypothetical protein
VAIIEIAKVQVRRGLENQTGIPQLDSGELGWAEDTENLYIGKRIADGAVDDTNTRILTENDLNNIYSLITANNVGNFYQYRSQAAWVQNTVASTVNTKLDLLVSLYDYGLTANTGTNVTTATIDITYPLQQAINSLYYDNPLGSLERGDAIRKLKIPAGNFYVSETIYLPPYASLEGEGCDMTFITFNTGSGFVTEDSAGNRTVGTVLTGESEPRNIQLEGLTLFSQGQDYSKILTLIEVNKAKIKDCRFGSYYVTTSTSYYNDAGNYVGVGIEMQGNCQDILIDSCTFTGLDKGVHGTGTVTRAVITNNIFDYLGNGIVYESDNQHGAPLNSVINYNKFSHIQFEAISVAEIDQVGVTATNHVVSFNYFDKVGNTQIFADSVSTSSYTYPVISYNNTKGNKTKDNWFSRQEFFTTQTNYVNNLYYQSLVSGSTTLDFSGSSLISAGNAESIVYNFPLNSGNQVISMPYLLTGVGYTRQGTLTMGITPAGDTILDDNYSYQVTVNTATTFKLDTSTAAINSLYFFTVNTATYSFFYDHVNASDGTWFVSPDGQQYAQLQKVYFYNNTLTCYITDNLDFSTLTNVTFSLLQSNDTGISFGTQNNVVNNYVSLVASLNTTTLSVSTTATYNLEYSVTITS